MKHHFRFVSAALVSILAVSSFTTDSLTVHADEYYGHDHLVEVTQNDQVVDSFTFNGITSYAYASPHAVNRHVCDEAVENFFRDQHPEAFEGSYTFETSDGSTITISNAYYAYQQHLMPVSRPRAGDMATFPGHVAIVRSVNGDMLTMFEQNAWINPNDPNDNRFIVGRRVKLGTQGGKYYRWVNLPAHIDPGKEVVMYRMYNSYTGEHLYTADTDEVMNLINAGWDPEGCGWIAPTSGDPVYRLYNPYSGEHFYTLNEIEKDDLVKLGWIYEDIAFFSDPEKAVPVYREYNRYAKAYNHNYTSDINEHHSLIASGWVDESIAWYGLNHQD